jgi:DNA segregation ATPase FtsK/SpoIIIE, S-DNA-T family
MAKKKHKRSVREVEESAPIFWRIVWALILLALGIFILFGFFTDAPIPKTLKDASFNAFGWSALLVPLGLLYLSITKILHEERKLSWIKLVQITSLLLVSSAWFDAMFAHIPVEGDRIGGHGGTVGAFLGGLLVGLVGKILGSFICFVLSLIFGFLLFGISPMVLLRVFNIFKRRERVEGEESLAELKAKASEHHFKMNEGVPVEHHDKNEKPSPRLSTLKNSAQKLSGNDDHAALTIASDPNWQFPSYDLLNQKQDKADAGDVEGNADLIRETFANFNIDVEMEGANIGPRVTQFTMRPPTGVKLSKITALENNLALDLAAQSIRMEAPIPGKRAVGIEVPNRKSAIVRVASVLQSQEWKALSSPLGFILGKDIGGQPVVGSLDKMPHLLIAGQTGSGKSVMINTLLTSLLYRNSPADLKLILVDPKQVELTPYNDIPHLLTPVINEPEKCISALKWAVAEMERRLKAFAAVNKRNIAEYNLIKKEEGMPYIVIVIDELADLMMMAARDVEALVVRIAQKARAAGIHLVLATQRPSVDVITGLIKANVPARIAFTVASQVDSRTIIDGMGAEKLLGQGDMLFLTSEMPKPKRVQGAFIGDDETMKVTDFLRMQRPPQYDDEVVSQPVQLNGRGGVVADYGATDADDDMWRDAVRVVIEGHKASTSLLQRRLRVGYARAARLIETMEEQGIVGPADGARPRDVLVSSMDEVFGGGARAIEVEDGDVYDDMPDDDKDEY